MESISNDTYEGLFADQIDNNVVQKMEVERKSPEKALLCAGSNMDDLLAAVDVEMGSQNNSALEEGEIAETPKRPIPALKQAAPSVEIVTWESFQRQLIGKVDTRPSNSTSTPIYSKVALFPPPPSPKPSPATRDSSIIVVDDSSYEPTYQGSWKTTPNKHHAKRQRQEEIDCACCLAKYPALMPRCVYCSEWTSFNQYFKTFNLYLAAKREWQKQMELVSKKLDFAQC